MMPTSIGDSPQSAVENRTPGARECDDSRLARTIAASWQRSSACGLDQDGWRELPYNSDFDDDSRLIRATRPVLDRLVTTMADTPNSMLLADQQGRIVQRWVGKKSLHNTLDQAQVAPGFGFQEEFAGTNGVGTALEESTTVAVRGEEHYADFLRRFSCVGVPIHHPITHSVEGILDLTCLARDYNPLMPPLLVEAVRHIETRLTQMSSPSEVALLEEFVRTCRTHRGAVVALHPNMILTNPTAVQHLTPTDQAVLWEVASTLAAGGRLDGTVDLAGGRFRLRCTPVQTNPKHPAGMVLRLDTHSRSTRGNATVANRGAVPPPPSLPGRSRQWQQVVSRIHDLADADEPVTLTGEPGTGKLRLAKHLYELSSQQKNGLRVFDAVTKSVEPTPLLHQVGEALSLGDTVILRRIDNLPHEALVQLHSLIGYAPDTPPGQIAGRLITTSRTTTNTPEMLDRVLARFPHHVWVPPLHQRAEDIADLTPALLAELAGQPTPHCSPPVIQGLMRYPWPGNVAELRDVLTSALATSDGRQIETRHLPSRVLKRAPQRHLSPLEHSERSVIIETLDSVNGNRTEAAHILGIGRATLYRKMRNLGIASDRELSR